MRARVDVARQRLRFRVAHELGHTLFYNRRVGRVPERVQSGGVDEERFCDDFAAALLLPESAAAQCHSPLDLLAAQARYDVSLEMAVRRIAKVQGGEAALFYWTPTDRRLVIQWSSTKASRRLREWTRAARGAIKEAHQVEREISGEVLILRDRRQAVGFTVT